MIIVTAVRVHGLRCLQCSSGARPQPDLRISPVGDRCMLRVARWMLRGADSVGVLTHCRMYLSRRSVTACSSETNLPKNGRKIGM